MDSVTKPPQFRFPWFGICLFGIWLFSVGVRFWGLGRFNTLVFDEVYYAKFAHQYLSHQPFFDGHPPLSKYIIAISIWLGEQVPFGQAEKNGLTGGLYAPWTYRWLNALTGSFLPLVIAGVAYQLLHRQSYALIAALLAALDGLLLVESRYALNNVYLLIFGLVGWWGLLLALNTQPRADSGSETLALRRAGWLVLAGVGFGASASIKWNGLWFLLGAYGLWCVAQGLAWLPRLFSRLSSRRPRGQRLEELSPAWDDTDSPDSRSPAGPPSPLQRLAQLHGWQVGLYLGVVPFVTYALEWIPHLTLNAKQGYWQDFWALQDEILSYHLHVGNGPTVHPYCSPWYSWLVMWRPVAYFYQVTGKGDPLPTEQSLPPTNGEQVIYDVHAMGNPILWWLSTIAIALCLVIVIGLLVQWVQGQRRGATATASSMGAIARQWQLQPTEQWLVIFLLVNYAAQLLPWARVTRCAFLYHYMGAYLFASLALAWLLDRWLRSDRPSLRYIGIATLMVIGLAFLYWLPIYLGLPISPDEFNRLMWLKSWI